MKIRNKFLLVLFVLLLAMSVSGRKNLKHETLSKSYQSETYAEVSLKIGLSEMTLQAGDKNDLILVEAEYDEEVSEPSLMVDRDGKTAYIEFEVKDRDKWSKKKERHQSYDVFLNPLPEYQLSLENGLSENDIDLSGLKIKRLDIEAGLAETELKLKEPNSIRANRVNIEVGLGSLTTENLGMLRFNRLNAEVGMGHAVLDFSGFDGDGEVTISAGMGSVKVILSEDVGATIYTESSLFSSIDLDDMVKTGRNRYQSENYDRVSSHIDMELEVGMGSIELSWR